MKRKTFLLSLLMTAFAAQAQTTYKLVWSDEFDSSISANWNKEVTANPSNNELQYYTASSTNVKVSNGNLILTGKRQTKGTKSFTSGRVNTNGKVYFTHGMVMARIKLPKTKGGLWPAFWMMGNDISTKGWPYCGEMDIVEWGNSGGFGGNEETYFSAAVHWGDNWSSHQYYSYATNNTYSVQDDYHIWKCLWTEDAMRCYLDDQEQPYFEALIGDGYGPQPYTHKPNHVLLNLAIGGDFPGILDPAKITALPNSGSTAEMYIDWVRIYQPEDAVNVKYVENDMDKVAEEDRTITVNVSASGSSDTGSLDVPAAPTPDYDAANVRSLFCDAYTGVGRGSFFETWGSSGETVKTVTLAEGDQATEVKNFGYVGFNYCSDYSSVNMSGMEYMHCDIYPSKDMSIGITPISTGPQEYDEIFYTVQGGKWNSVDVKLSDFKAKNSAIDYSKAFQTKWFGGDQKSTIYIDNVFYFKGAISGIEEVKSTAPGTLYDLQGRKITAQSDNLKGIYIKDGRKVVF
jgi:beta-glucanase (GH16 family)